MHHDTATLYSQLGLLYIFYSLSENNIYPNGQETNLSIEETLRKSNTVGQWFRLYHLSLYKDLPDSLILQHLIITRIHALPIIPLSICYRYYISKSSIILIKMIFSHIISRNTRSTCSWKMPRHHPANYFSITYYTSKKTQSVIHSNYL